MQIYLVGGAIRDQILGIPVSERDWVVVGATPEEMVAAGYQPVGKEFPVFLHPETHEEYALARTERKTGKGYKGFHFYADPCVTLEQDLARRDLTINAIAQEASGRRIDPFHGQEDIAEKIFRHVSPAFQEDPVRILRLARLATKLTEFQVHPQTLQLMKNMVQAGEVDALVAERVWQEFQRALSNKDPCRFFQILQACGALSVLFPSISLGGEGIKRLQQAPITLSPWVRFAILTHDMEIAGLRAMIQRYKIPNQYAELALLVNRQLPVFTQLSLQTAEPILNFLLQSDALRRWQRFNDFLLAIECCLSKALLMHKQFECVQQSLQAIRHLDTHKLQQQNLVGEVFAKRLFDMRLAAITKVLKDYNRST